MTILRSYRFITTVVLLLAGGVAFAQPGTTTDPSISGGGQAGVTADWKSSQENDGAWVRVNHKSKAIPWQYLREDDIMWKKRVWREIDTREKQNMGFRYEGDENTGGGMFIEILIDALKKGRIKGYKATIDDRFTTAMTKDEIMESVSGKTDSIPVEDPVTGNITIQVIKRDFDPNAITKFRIKEDWIFDRNVGGMVVRIVGIAPVRDVIGDDGSFRGQQAMFWLYYPNLRKILAEYEVFNPQNDLARYTWDEFFENRQFSSKITKVSSTFVNDEGFKAHMNSMESLYESQHTAEEIFNKEHDMWVY